VECPTSPRPRADVRRPGLPDPIPSPRATTGRGALGLAACRGARASGGGAAGPGSPGGPAPGAPALARAQALATGALHEDGLADSADGLWGGGTRERRLEIMRDSRIGSYGALALILSVLLRWSALAALLDAGPAWGPSSPQALSAAGRWPGCCGRSRPPAMGAFRASSGGPGAPPWPFRARSRSSWRFSSPAGPRCPPPSPSSGPRSSGPPSCRARLHGQTGDTCGAAQQLAETAALLALAA
jgi:adenosylcobinamide-GDP ribazoletransferase